jgi:hypothetical protein
MLSLELEFSHRCNYQRAVRPDLREPSLNYNNGVTFQTVIVLIVTFMRVSNLT